MIKPLQPKSALRNTHPLLEHRLAAARNGWTQNPCGAKNLLFTGWNKIDSGEHAIETLKEWRSTGARFVGTGIRIVGELCVIDSDVTIRTVSDLIMADLEALDPDAFNKAMIRDSGAVTLAVFFRYAGNKVFKQFKTHAYTAHPELLPELAAARAMPTGTVEADKARGERIRAAMQALQPQKLETYGPHAKTRFFQYEGPHSPGRDYHCWEQAPWNTKVADLPVLPIDPAEFIDRCDAIMGEHLTRIPEEVDSGGEVVYDLTPDTLFYPKDGEAGRIEDLVNDIERQGAESGIYGCLASTLDSRSRANCKLYISTAGHIIVTDWSHDARKHYMASDEPPPRVEITDATRAALDKIRDNQGQSPPPPPTQPPDEPEPAPDAEPGDVLQFMLRNYAVDRHAGMIVDLRATDIDRALIEVATFHLIYGAYRVFNPPRTPRGQGTWTPVSRIFLVHSEHITVTGTRFRPDQPFPLYADASGHTYKNVWRKPVHTGDCDIGWLIETFFPIFIPDPAEREWYLDVTAHRWMFPAIPGPSVVMVAHGAVSAIGSDFGTGRSGWFDFQARLWGRRYVRNEDFSVVTGQNKQGDFTSWKAFKRLVTIDEAKTTPEQNTMKGGSATYEILKTMVDPSPRWRTFKVKYGKPFEEFDYAPLDIASNHQGAVSVPTGDRRFGVINNGRPLTEPEAEMLYAMVNHPGAPAAFARWCERRDLSRFKPFAPPPIFAAKARMQVLSESELDGVFAEMEKQFGRIFTKSQAREFALNRMETRPSIHDVQFDKRFDAAFRFYCTVLRDRSGDGDLDIRVQRPPGKSPVEGIKIGEPKRERAYTFEARKTTELDRWKPHARGPEIAKSEAAIPLPPLFRVIDGGNKNQKQEKTGPGAKKGPVVND